MYGWNGKGVVYILSTQSIREPDVVKGIKASISAITTEFAMKGNKTRGRK